MQQYEVLEEITDARGNRGGTPQSINIPVGTICTEERRDENTGIIYVSCLLPANRYHKAIYNNIAFPPFMFRATDDEPAYVKEYTAPETSGGHRRRTFRRTFRRTYRSTKRRRTIKHKNKKRRTHRSF